jgi:hypothetical protein
VWNLVEQIVAQDCDASPSPVYAGQYFSQVKTSVGNQLPSPVNVHTNTHTNNLRSQDFQRLRQNSWQNFLKATQCKQAYCISTHTLFQSDYSDYSDSNSLQLFQLLQSDYQLPTNDRQLTINC